jgi:hypothetical protein
MISSFVGYEEKSLNDLYIKPLEQILEMPLEKRNIRWFKLVKMYSRQIHLKSPGKKTGYGSEFFENTILSVFIRAMEEFDTYKEHLEKELPLFHRVFYDKIIRHVHEMEARICYAGHNHHKCKKEVA